MHVFQYYICNDPLLTSNVLEKILEHEEFQIPTTEAEKALHAAKNILTWLDRDEPHDKSLYNAYVKYVFSIWTSVPPENDHI